ncbi:MAG: CHC2 zinc finger domain-containing protein [Lachnospiraceae bacterium]|nr:CHC2 zinc finger domain-containing protein [Lachnospiraceae bacterium]
METDIFRCVKQNVTTRDAAERYGIRVSGNGMARCPFHPDRTPSMKVDTRYHCFGCGADGDVISFVSRLFDLEPIDSARKIAEDFGIAIPERESLTRAQRREATRRQKKAAEIRDRDKQYREIEQHFLRSLIDYHDHLREWMETLFPRAPDEEPDPRFVEAAQNITHIEYVLDCFFDAGMQERIEIMNDMWKKVETFERKYSGPSPGESEAVSGAGQEKRGDRGGGEDNEERERAGRASET